MATSQTSTEMETDDEEPQTFRLRSEVNISFTGSIPSPAEVRGLLTPMAIEEQNPGIYRVTEDEKIVTTNLNSQECTCCSQANKGEYLCRHYYHIRHRRETGTAVDPPDREDPVTKRDRKSAPVAEAARRREAKLERAGGVVAGPGQALVQCCSCGEYGRISNTEQVSTEPYLCSSCPPIDESIAYLLDPQNSSDGFFVCIRGVVTGEYAKSYYPEGESVFSLEDMFSSVDGVMPTDSVVLVSKTVDSDCDALVFESDTQPVPQGALRPVIERDI